jgi:hypothetical protein
MRLVALLTLLCGKTTSMDRVCVCRQYTALVRQHDKTHTAMYMLLMHSQHLAVA